MNKRISQTTLGPNSKNEECAKFIIDDVNIPYVLSGTTEYNQEYTLSMWVRADSKSVLKIYEKSIEVNEEWSRKQVTFKALGNNLNIFFGNTGTYYFYKTQLELGKLMSDASPSPEDIEESLKETNAKFELVVNKETLKSEINALADTFTFTGNGFIVNAKNLTIAEDGTITAVNGKFTGIIEATEGKIAKFNIGENGLVYGDINTGVYTQISGKEIRWIAGIEEEFLNEINGKTEFFRENRWFQFYTAYKNKEDEEFSLTPVGGFDARGVFTGESYQDFVINPAEYLLTWDGYANFKRVKTSDLSSDTSVYIKCNGTTENDNNKYAIRFFRGDNDTAWFRPCADGLTNLGGSNYHWDNIYAKNGQIQTSDRNRKKNIQYLDDKYIELFDFLIPKTFKMKDGKRTHVGFIAQEVEEAMKTLGLSNEEFAGLCIDRDEEGNAHYSLRYDELFMLCVAKLKQLERKILNEH